MEYARFFFIAFLLVSLILTCTFPITSSICIPDCQVDNCILLLSKLILKIFRYRLISFSLIPLSSRNMRRVTVGTRKHDDVFSRAS